MMRAVLVAGMSAAPAAAGREACSLQRSAIPQSGITATKLSVGIGIGIDFSDATKVTSFSCCLFDSDTDSGPDFSFECGTS